MPLDRIQTAHEALMENELAGPFNEPVDLDSVEVCVSSPPASKGSMREQQCSVFARIMASASRSCS